ncbi:Lrp/AsnC family transcriptional regulator [Microbacterium sp. NPDC055683]
MQPLGDLDRRIAAALLRDGRAPWRRVAEAIGEQERTVSRRGSRLLADGVVRIHALPGPWRLAGRAATLVRVRGGLRVVEAVAEHLADHPLSTWVSVLANPVECVAELFHGPQDLRETLSGIERSAGDARAEVRATLLPAYHRTVSGWSPEILAAGEYDAVGTREDAALATTNGARAAVDELTARLVDLLQEEGRATVDELASSLGVSASTVSRRIDSAVRDGLVFIRAVVDPALLGYPCEAVIEVRARPGALPRIAGAVADAPEVRWAADDGSSVLAQAACADAGHLGDLLHRLGALDDVVDISASPVVAVAKRSTVRYRDGVPSPR